MRRKSEQTKIKNKYGTGVLGQYKPWIEVGEFGSIGTCSVITDWITGRPVHLLSQAEAYVWYLLRFNPNVLDIREQYPLKKDITKKIADKYGYKHPIEKATGDLLTMTTDFLVTMKNKSMIAISVKASEKSICKNKRNKEKLEIEKEYWETQNVEFKLYTKDTINQTLVDNIRFVSIFYNLNDIDAKNDINILKHLISRHVIEVDLQERINYSQLSLQHQKEIEQWKILKLK